jgi:hypothetical protein
VTFTLQLNKIEYWKLKMFTKLENIKCKVMKCTLSVHIPYFWAISHTGTITLQYIAHKNTMVMTMTMMMMMMMMMMT